MSEREQERRKILGNLIQPVFDNSIVSDAIVNHLSNLKPYSSNDSHDEILEKLLEQIQPIDFLEKAFPAAKSIKQKILQIEIKISSNCIQKIEIDKLISDKNSLLKELKSFKLSAKHYYVISIENIISVAIENRWNICKNHDFIYLFNGSFWQNIDKDSFQLFLSKAAEKMGVDKIDARFYQFIDHLYKQFITSAYFPNPHPVSKEVLVNLLNGTFVISPSGNRLRPFNSADFITYQLPFEYNPSANAPQFFNYLQKVLPDSERQNILAEFLGYLFIKHNSKTLKEEKALILYGSGANGKSVFFDIVTALLANENVSNYTLQNLTEEKGFYRAKIANKLLNYCSDISTKLEVAIFKQLVSGEPTEACLKFGQPFTMDNYAKFIFNCNELPKDIEHSNAYFRRFLIIPFDVTIPENEQDKELSYKIIESELAGVFNWVLSGLERLLKQKKFSHCEAADKAIQSYKTESNSVALFLQETAYSKSSSNYVLIKEIYSEYKNFCFEDGMKPFGKRNFIKQLENMGLFISRQGGTGQKIVNLAIDTAPF